MADSTISDISKMKVVDLRKELKSRGLSYSGDKAELVARLQAAMPQDSQDEHADINLDSDEIDSDGVLDDDDDKTHNDILEDSAVDTINEDLALADRSPEKPIQETKPQRMLKRKNTTEAHKESNIDVKDGGTKKIILNRAISLSSSSNKAVPAKEEKNIEEQKESSINKIKISSDLDMKTRLELRAKRFGLPVKIPEDARKEARKQRFGQITSDSSASKVSLSGTLSDNIDKLKKRSERFGQSVSSLMGDIENKERLEKRKAKFGIAK